MAGRIGGADPDSCYVQDCRQVQNSTHAIQTLTGQISKQVGNLETEKDFVKCRGMVDDAVRQASETKQALARIREHQNQAVNPAEKNNRRMMYHKLSDNLAITARVLEDVVRRFQAEEAKRPSFFEPVRQAADADAAGGEEAHPLAGGGLGMGGGITQLDQELNDERCHALKQVGEDMRCLQRIYTDLAVAAEESQATFDSLETHMANASADIEKGREQIQIMDRFSWTDKVKRKFFVIGVGAAAVFIMGSYLSAG